MSLSPSAPSIDRRLLLTGGLAAAIPLGGCTGKIRVDDHAGGASRLASAAQTQLGVTRDYDPAYVALSYPGGDVPRKTGVCADVVIRAARDGLGQDLQTLIHEDMTEAFSAYPARWGLKKPDANIDHRRVPNLETWFERRGGLVWRAAADDAGKAFPEPLQVGDILTWRGRKANAPHIGVITRTGRSPLILHNFGSGVMQHPLWLTGLWLRAHGHYRWPGAAS
jgi:uncharacterized protein YijF (DUF1287 family)